MLTATLIAPPSRADLTGSAARELPQAWSPDAAGGRWLSPGEALDVDLGARPGSEALAQEAERWRERGVDLVVQPAEDRRRSVLVADMDSTMIDQECVDELAAVAGAGPRVAAVTARAMAGELDFETALHERVALLRDLPVSAVAEVLRERITLAPGAATLVATMRAHGGYAALVSGGFTLFTGPVAHRLGVDEHRANTLETSAGRLTGRVRPPVLGAQAKLTALQEIAIALGRTPADVLAVGDGANDLPMLLAAGTGVALHAKPRVAERSPYRIDHGDLTALLWVQGYRREELVRAD